MNRKERREAWQRARGNKDALWCPICKKKAMFVAVHDKDIDHYDVYCEVCNSKLGRTREGHDGVFGEGYIQGHLWTKGNVTERAMNLVMKTMEMPANSDDKKFKEACEYGKSVLQGTDGKQEMDPSVRERVEAPENGHDAE